MGSLGAMNAKAIVETVVYGLVFIILFWGGTNKFGKKKEFNDDYASLEVMKSIRGIAAIGVMLHHVSQEFAFQEAKALSPFVNAGAYFVAIFFFCSGYGLIKSLDTKKDYLKGFIRKRIVRAIVVPFYVNVLIYGIFMLLVKMPFTRTQWITNLVGVTMMNEYAWFPIVLSLLYLVFFICFRFIKNRPVCFAILFVFIVALGIGTCINGHFAWWAGPNNWWMTEQGYMSAKWWMHEKVFWFSGEWWVNSAPAFLAGLIFANYENKIVPFIKKKYAITFFILLVITLALNSLSDFGQARFGYWTEYNMNGPEIANKIKTYFCQIPLFFVLGFTVIVFLMKYHTINPVTKFFGKYSLHTYLMNLMAIMSFRFLEIPDTPFYNNKMYLFYYCGAVILISTLLGIMELKITDFVQRLLFERRQKVVYSTEPRFMADDDLKKIMKESQLKAEEEKASKAEAKGETKAEPKAEVKPETKPAPKAAKPAQPNKAPSGNNKKKSKNKKSK